MNEADILAATYYHTCTVKRPTAAKHNDWDDFDKRVVYRGLPCAVSFTQLANGGETETVQHVDYVATLFVRPEIVIQPGDEIHADVHGQAYVFVANEPARYPSHLEVPLIRSGYA